MGNDLEYPSGEHHMNDCRPNANIYILDCGNVGCDANGALMNSPTIDEANKEDIRSNLSGKVIEGRIEASAGEHIEINSLKIIDPHDGMEFESKEEAFSFYKEYAKTVGFATIIKASRRSRISGNFIDAKFVCTRYGNKRESAATQPVSITESTASIPVKKKRGRINQSWSKTDCKACMHVKRRQDGRWTIRCFIKEHNHDIFPDQAYYFRGHRNLDLGSGNADALHAIRGRTKKMYVTMSRQSRVYKKVEKHKGGIINQLSGARHLDLDEEDARVMLDHFMSMQDENPNFFYAIDLNEEQCLRNVFWVDGKGRLDYGNFDDVVFFDTTYIKNEYKLPFAPFMGVNNHFQFLLLGCAVVADETKSTYVWLMQAWLRAMGGHAPRVIFTDQDTALKEAIAEVFPDSRHCFCLWHVLKKMPERLSYVIRQHENFLTKFEKCIYRSWTHEQFEKRWWKLVDNFNMRNDTWFQSLYDDREHWIPTFMGNTFLAGMSTAQRSESINYFFDKYLQRKTTLREFLEQYKTILRDKYEEEAKADFETWHKQPALKSPSPFGKQMAMMYTHAIFKKFQVEVLGVVACHPRKESEDGETKKFRVQDFEEDQDFIVMWNVTTLEASCLCHSFEFNGFLCRHVLIVLQMSGVHNIPSQYVLKRWTKDAKSMQTMRQGANLAESRVQRYNDLCRRAFKLGDEGSLSQESYDIAFRALEEALRKCESMNNSVQSVIEVTEPTSPSVYGPNEIEDANQGNNTNKANKKDIISKKRKEHSETEVITIGMHDSWRVEQPNARSSTHDNYFGTQQIVHGMGQLNSIAPTRDEYYNNQHSIQGLGQLNSIAPIHDSHYMTHQRMHGMGQLHFRSSSTIPSCFDIQDSLQDMDQPSAGSSQLHGMASEHLNSKHVSS